MTTREDRRTHLAIAAIVAVGILLRLFVLRAPGFPTDVDTFRAWAERLAQLGPGGFYEPGYFSDYPPAFLYVLWLLGALFDGEALRLAVKASSIPFDAAIAVFAAVIAWRAAGRVAAVLAAALWMLAPGPIFAGPYWGQVDAVGTLPLMAALHSAGRRRWAAAGLFAGVALMVKPQFGVGLVVVAAAALFTWIREGQWRPPVRVAVATGVAVLALGLPFRSGPVELVGLVRSAAETYPYTSLFAFNIWSIVGDFWRPDDAYVVPGAVLLVAGLAASCAPLWRRRDVATLLAVGTLASLAFYFLPTRAHERYLFPVFALLLPLAVTRARLLWPYVALAASFALTLYFAFTRYPQIVDLRTPEWLEATLFTRGGQILVALVMLGLAAAIAWRLARGDASLEPETARAAAARGEPAARGPWRLPAALAPGGPPTRRDLTAAFLVALVVLATRGFRLDEPRDMYFDEVYHARTAYELLAQREPYEWTHPPLAKEIMALGILAFGDNRVVGSEPALADAVALAVGNDGLRVYATAGGGLEAATRDGQRRSLATGLGPVRAAAIDGGQVIVATDTELLAVPLVEPPAGAPIPRIALPFQGAATRGLALAEGRIAVATTKGLALYPSFGEQAQVVPGEVVAVTAKPDASEYFVLEPAGVVRAIDAVTGQERLRLSGGGPGTAIAYVQAPDRLFVARADTPALDVQDLQGRSLSTVPLANARTGAFASGATALAVVTRSQFLYALADGRVVVVEPHGASPFASIPVTGSLLGVDGEGDKLVVAGAGPAQLVETGRSAFAWRLPGLVFAALLAFFLYLLARRLFRSPLVAYLAAGALVVDGSMFAQARIGMNDVYVGFFIVASWYFIAAAHAPRRSAALDILIAGVLVGFGVAAKWAAVYTLGGIFVASLFVTGRAYLDGRIGGGGPLDLLAGRGRNLVLLAVAFALIPLAIYLGSYRSWFGGPMQPYGWSLWELQQQMYWYHSSLTAPHCAASPWWAWPLDLKPVYWYFGAAGGGWNAYVYDAGNIVLFWVALPASAIVAGYAVRARSAALALVVFAMLTQLVAWIPISRVLFFYHFFTALPFYLLALAIVLALVFERRRRAVVVYGAIAAAVFVLFYPYVSAVPVPGELGAAYQILPTWQYDPTFYPTDSCPTPISASIASSLTVGVAWVYELASLALGVAVAADVGFVRRALARLGL